MTARANSAQPIAIERNLCLRLSSSVRATGASAPVDASSCVLSDEPETMFNPQCAEERKKI